jgi:outer membrane immunogenic protein
MLGVIVIGQGWEISDEDESGAFERPVDCHGAATSASGADVSRPMPRPYMVPAYNWTGFYVGANLGGGWTRATLSDSFTGVQIGDTSGGVIGGGQLGFNYQTGNFVLGAEWMFDGISISTSHTVAGLQGSTHTNWVTTIAGRFGWAADNVLYYGKAGGGWTDTNWTLMSLADGTKVTGSNNNAGWLLGAGIEYGVIRNLTVKLEYDYLGPNTRNSNSTSLPPIRTGLASNRMSNHSWSASITSSDKSSDESGPERDFRMAPDTSLAC